MGSKELRAFAAAMSMGESASNPHALRGHRAFWCSDYAVHSSQSPYDQSAWVATLLMHSNRTIPAACVNGEGAMNEHVGDGMIYLYYNGSEYNGIFHSWNWTRLPGITAEQVPVESCNYARQLQVDSRQMTYTGTVSDGIQGLSAMLLVSHNLTAKKAVAFLPHAIVSLVAGVRCSSDN